MRSIGFEPAILECRWPPAGRDRQQRQRDRYGKGGVAGKIRHFQSFTLGMWLHPVVGVSKLKVGFFVGKPTNTPRKPVLFQLLTPTQWRTA